MKAEYVREAIEICRDSHSTEVKFNHVPEDDIVSNAIPLVILNCCASVINKLVKAGFSLFLTDVGLEVQKY